MPLRLYALLCGLLLSVPGGGRADEADKDADRLQGTWAVLTNESGGGKTDEEYNRRDGYRLVVAGRRLTWKSKSVGDNEVAFRLDPAKTPKALDLDVRDGRVGNECIYELDGDRLRICIAHFGQPRPTEFRATAKASLLVLRRAKG
jgi:uncharacterized protein (TIGR03067 family)